MKSTRYRLDFEALRNRVGSYHGLSIYPPGAWFGSPHFHVFVGGCGHGTKRTLDTAKKFLLAEAKKFCAERIALARADLEHYERELQKLESDGLGAAKKVKR